jgi:hypothetical protein
MMAALLVLRLPSRNISGLVRQVSESAISGRHIQGLCFRFERELLVRRGLPASVR